LLSLLGEPPWVSLLSMRRGNHFMTPFKRCKLASGENKCFKGENITGCLEGNNFKCGTCLSGKQSEALKGAHSCSKIKETRRSGAGTKIRRLAPLDYHLILMTLPV
jgi:hypothetical protein